MLGRNIIVVGASSGGVEALSRLIEQLPADLNAAVLVVLHIGTGRSRLHSILGRAGRLPVTEPHDGEEIETGHVYVAPPDLHMMVDDGRLRLTRGPKENFTRPAIDPLFRSAAIAYGPRVVGVLLTGRLDDGAAGLIAIKDRGGIVIVQDPNEAIAPSMPQSAIAATAVDHICPIAEMGPLLVGYDPPQMRLPPVPPAMESEHKVTAMEAFLSDEDELDRLGTASPLTCPECHGVLYRLHDERLLRFRCRAGHAMSARTLVDHLADAREDALWSSVRALTEEAWLAHQLDPADAKRMTQLVEGVQSLRAMLRSAEPKPAAGRREATDRPGRPRLDEPCQYRRPSPC